MTLEEKMDLLHKLDILTYNGPVVFCTKLGQVTGAVYKIVIDLSSDLKFVVSFREASSGVKMEVDSTEILRLERKP